MADISETWTWEKVVPALGNNRELASPFFLLIKSNLTILQRDDFEQKLTALLAEDADDERFAAFISEWVRIGDEPLNVTVDGEQVAVTTVLEYVRLLKRFSGVALWMELIGSVRYVNSTEGSRASFSERVFGGSAYMTMPTGAKLQAPKPRR